ncbi:hypothetical protein QZK05_02065 [Acinetobacter baumannii]|nr:hypothetical protein [Acinetobacter baumannii]
MDKKALQEQFEAIAIQNCWNINKYPAGWDGHGDDEYVDDFVSGAWWGFQEQQAKVEEQAQEIANLKSLIQGHELRHQQNLSIKQKLTRRSEELEEEFAEDERFLKEQIKDKDLKISNLEYQQGMDKELIQALQSKSAKLQKRVDSLELKIKEIANIAMRARRGEYQTESGRNAGLNIAAQIERALKGDQYDEHRKKAEEAISKGASLTNHRIEL